MVSSGSRKRGVRDRRFSVAATESPEVERLQGSSAGRSGRSVEGVGRKRFAHDNERAPRLIRRFFNSRELKDSWSACKGRTAIRIGRRSCEAEGRVVGRSLPRGTEGSVERAGKGSKGLEVAFSKAACEAASRNRRDPPGLVSSCRGVPVAGVFLRFSARVRAAARF